MYTASTAFLDALFEAGVTHVFANFGSDHPALIESLAEARATGRPCPQVITCPNEMVAISAAHGHAMVSGRAQAVIVHVESGTLGLAGGIHNVAKGRVPVLIFAGTSPFTQEGELKGSRNEFIHWIQDVFDQRGIVRQYMKYDHEIRTGRNIKQIVHRALQTAHSDPPGPSYLMAGREVMEEEVSPVVTNRAEWPAVKAGALPASAVEQLAGALLGARRPLVVTSYLGRSHKAFDELVRLCHKLSIGVLESVPNYANYPADDPLYQGNVWNDPRPNPILHDADLILVLDSDVPWIPAVSRPQPGATIYHIDVDPLKRQMPLWYIPAQHVFQTDCATALEQINQRLRSASIKEPRTTDSPDCLQSVAGSRTTSESRLAACAAIDEAAIDARREQHTRAHEERRRELLQRERRPDTGLTVEYVTARIREHLGPDAVTVHEGVTNSRQLVDHLMPLRAGALFTSGGGALGWSGGAAVGVKLALPHKTVACLTGDGSYLFSIPSSVHWISRRYQAPFLHVIYNNGGWRAPKLSMLAVHPDGYASRADDINVAFDPPPDYAAIAIASGAGFGRTVREADELEQALTEALGVVRQQKRSAVLDVYVPRL
ncbi:MAG: thiamine pyrophosphate-requiring protein [Acidobacteriaceae bacterium]|nr:thiamine pyrophosphate-requiring protein [Acidobacteriaceae bacterium]